MRVDMMWWEADTYQADVELTIADDGEHLFVTPVEHLTDSLIEIQGYPVHSGLIFKGKCDFRPVYGIDLDGLLGQAVKQFAAMAGLTSVESKCEFVEVVVKIFVANGSLVCAEEPAF